MDLVLLLARLVLAAVFLVAGVAKLVDRRGSIQAMRDFGMPDRLASPLGIALPIAALAVENGTPVERPATGPQEPISGLRVGTPAPSFALQNLAGQTTTLADLRVANTPTLLVFSDPGCGPCTALMPEIGRWQQEHAGRLTIAVVSRGDLEANRSKAGEHGVRNVVLQQNREVAEAYEVRGTPSAVLIRADGMIGSAIAAGAEAIRGLVTTATTTPPPTVPVRAGNGNAQPAARPNLIGKPAPDATLSTLDGEQVALSSVLGEPTTLLFWNPGCGFCNRMFDDLKALEADPPADAPKIVVISTGDAERNRAQAIRSTVLLDQGFAAGRQFGATGTPSAVLIDAEGRVASHIAVGGPLVLELAGQPAPRTDRNGAHASPGARTGRPVSRCPIRNEPATPPTKIRARLRRGRA